MSNRLLVASICACLIAGNTAHAADDCGITATFQSFIDFIKFGCHQEFPNDQAKWVECSTRRYEAMKAFHEKLYRYRDTQGIQSAGFKRGLDCVDEASPRVNEPDRKIAMERANWIKANNCLESFTKK